MSHRECSTQAEADAAAAAGDVIVWRARELYAYDSARVYAYDSASVYASDSASVFDGTTKTLLRRDRPRLILGPLGPLGSRGDTLGVSLPSDGSEPIVYAGCWSGRLSDFAARVNEVYPTGRHGDEYRATIAYIRAIAAIPQDAT